MKISIDIDCTPEEARTFLGLPDPAPIHAALGKAMQERIRSLGEGADLEQLAKIWMPAGLQGLDQMQKMFWSNLAGAGRTGGDKE